MLHMKEIPMYVCRKVRSLERALEAALYAFCGELSGDRGLYRGSYREFLLRQKLEDGNAEMIRTVRGVGYRFCGQEKES